MHRFHGFGMRRLDLNESRPQGAGMRNTDDEIVLVRWVLLSLSLSLSHVSLSLSEPPHFPPQDEARDRVEV